VVAVDRKQSLSHTGSAARWGSLRVVSGEVVQGLV
jgi:hypothetical protein